MRRTLLDTGVLGDLCHANDDVSGPVAEAIARKLEQAAGDLEILVPEIADYELRRKLLHLLAKGQTSNRSLARLDELGRELGYLPLTTEAMRLASSYWAARRATGRSSAPEPALDGDVILAAQARIGSASVATRNRRHLADLVSVEDW